MAYYWQDTITDTLLGEVWEHIPFNHDVKISNFGRVKDKKGIRKLYRTNKGGKGNGYVITGINSQRQLVHRLVADCFIKNPNPDVFNQVNHIDGDKANNHYSNLEWCNNRLNVLHAVKTGLHKPMKGDKNGASTISNEMAKAIIRISLTSSLKNREAANYFGIPYSTFRKIKDGTHWSLLDSYRNKFL